MPRKNTKKIYCLRKFAFYNIFNRINIAVSTQLELKIQNTYVPSGYLRNQLSFKKYNTNIIMVHKKNIYYLQDISGSTTTPKKHEEQPIK